MTKRFPHDGTSLIGHGALRSRTPAAADPGYGVGDVLDTEHGEFTVTEVHPAPEGGEVSYSGLFADGPADGLVFVREVRGRKASQDEQGQGQDGTETARPSADPSAALAAVSGPSTASDDEPAFEEQHVATVTAPEEAPEAETADEKDETGEPTGDPFASALAAMG